MSGVDWWIGKTKVTGRMLGFTLSMVGELVKVTASAAVQFSMFCKLQLV